MTINNVASDTREYFLSRLDLHDGELLEFVPCVEECSGMKVIEVRFAHGIQFVLYQTLWNAQYYAEKNGEHISHTYWLKGLQKDSHIYVQRLINDIISGRYDNLQTPTEKYLKYIEEKNLTSYMNNTRWEQVFAIIQEVEEETGHEVQINYKMLEEEEETGYWSARGDEYLRYYDKRYFQWLKIKPIYETWTRAGLLLDEKYESEDHSALFLEKINKTNIKYEPLENEEGVFIIYGYK